MFSDNSSSRIFTVYKKTAVYFRANIEFSNALDLQHKIEDFESEISLDLDNLPSGNFDYVTTFTKNIGFLSILLAVSNGINNL